MAAPGWEQRPGEDADACISRLQDLLRRKDEELKCLREASNWSSIDLGQLPLKAQDSHDGSAGLEEAEAMLASQSQQSQNPGVRELVAGLTAACVYTDTPNHETNRKLWNAYASNWAADKDWVQKMQGHLPEEVVPLECIGDEWADKASLRDVLAEWLLPLTGMDVRAAEIGSGGGRVARTVAPCVKDLVCMDVSADMLKSCKLAMSSFKNVSYELLSGDSSAPEQYLASFDLVYSFDVFVHLDLHQMRRTLVDMLGMLRPGGMAFVSFANLLAPAGWSRFERQRHYSVGGFYFVSPDIVRCLLLKTGFEIVKLSAPKAGNTYLNRDLLVTARKPESA